MASPDSSSQPIIPDTLFPFLDTLYRGSNSHNSNSDTFTDPKSPDHVVDHYWLKQTVPQGNIGGEKSICEAYARFITALTGQDEVAFELVSSNKHSICHANAASVSEFGEGLFRKSVALQVIEATENARLEYGLYLTTEHITSSSISQKAFFVSIDRSPIPFTAEVTLRVSRGRASSENAQHLFNTFLRYLQSADHGDSARTDRLVDASVLNFPSLSRPPQFIQDKSPAADALLHHAFERRAAEHPDRVALDYLRDSSSQSNPTRETYTYRELNRLTDLLADSLLKRLSFSSRTSSVVPVLLSTSPELYISYLAVLKAGLAFCPLPTDAPTQRLQDIIDDFNPQILLGAKSYWQDHPTLKIDSTSQDGSSPWIDVADFVSENINTVHHPVTLPTPKESDVCYIMYTSGSTGKPKGVQITHLAATCSIASHSQTQLPPSSDGVPRWFQFAAPTFDPSLMEIFVTLSTGATLCSASRDLMLTDLESTITKLGTSLMMSTPSMAALLRPSNMPSLKSLWTMGETLLRKNIDDFASKEKSTNLVNAYGPTEGAINCTLLLDFHPEDRGSIIGPALPTCSLFVLDPDSMMPVPKGFVGELAIGGPQLSIGYLSRPEQNAKAFVESPEFGRLYRTGDKVRLVTDRKGASVVEFLGRIDDSQVKLSGRRVDLGEIDTVLAKCAGVKEAVTVSYKRFANQHGSEEAVAFIVLFDDDEVTVEEGCRKTAANLLPSYMCPSKYLFVEKLPRSAAGKLNRKALRALIDSSHQNEAVHEEVVNQASEGSLEATLCSVLSEVLGGLQVGPTTNIFSVGIDSLRAVRYLQRLRDLGINDLGVVDVLRTATPRALAGLILERSQNEHEAQINGPSHVNLIDKTEFFQKYRKICADHLDVTTAEIEAILPTTATQSGMLASFLRSSSNNPDGKENYIHQSVHHINASIDVQRLQQCWTAVLERHDAYRMIFLPIDDASAPFLQCVLQPSCSRITKRWKKSELYEDDDDLFKAAIRDALKNAEKSISLDTPPFELALITTPSRKAVVFSLFHAIFDGASLQLLFDEVNAEYWGKPIPGRTEISTAVDMHFDSDMHDTVEFWTEQMKDCEPTPFPCLTGLRPEVVSNVPCTTTYSSTTTINSLRSGAARSTASPLAILQAAWSLLLITYKDSWSSSTVGSVISGRLDPKTEICVGPTFTTIPITIPAKLFQDMPDATNRSILQHLTDLNAKSLDHLQIPLNSVLAPGGGLHYDTLLAYQDFASGTNASDLWYSVDYPAMGNDFAVMIEVWPEVDGTLRLRATYTNESLDEHSASLMLEQFNNIINHIIEQPETPYSSSRFEALPQGFAETIEATYDTDLLLHAPFELSAKQKPNDIALNFKKSLDSNGEQDIQWTYKELDHRANRLASYLVAKFGNIQDQIVPFSLEKSPELYVAILGILKAGAAWCPIDPTFPADRRRELIARTDAKMILVANNTFLQTDSAIPEGVVTIDLNSKDIANANNKLDLSFSPTPQNMAYLIWTSGTTGLPKGVMVEHQSAAIAMRSLRQVIRSSNDRPVRCLQFSQPTFDVFVQDLFYTWGLGGTLISATKEIMLGSFPALANETKATHAHLTPAFAAAVPRDQITTLEVVTFIGEALPQPIADDWSRDIIAYNTYGPAEAAVVSTVRQFAGCPNDFKSTNIGHVLPSVSAFVINNNNRVIKQGVGELALAGSQVARGYWKDPPKTQEKFLWNESVQAHVYMTGDIVRQLHDGSFEFVGRRDDLVKLNGMRVELSEISFALKDCHPDVEQVVTMHMTRPDRPSKVVVVFLSVPSWQEKVEEAIAPITHSGASDLVNIVMEQARKTLPEHMVPTIVIVLSNIPMTASAKIDRKALSNAYESLDLEAWDSSASPDSGSEWTSEEISLLEQVSKFSGVALNSINRSSRLVTMGIDSIGAIRLAARLKAAGYSVSIANLLQSRSIDDLCKILQIPETTSRDNGSQQLQQFNDKWQPAVSKYLEDDLGAFFVCPALPMQENLLSETFRNPQAYWSNHFFKLSDDIDILALENAWKLVASSNDALRIGFVPVAGVAAESANATVTSTFLQVISDEPNVDFGIEKYASNTFDSAAKQRALNIALKHQKSSFSRPCWAVTIFEQAGSRTMMFTIHHSIHDGPSLSFIMQDLANAYASSACSLTDRHQLRDAVAISLPAGAAVDPTSFWETVLGDFAADEDDTVEDSTKSKSSSGYNTTTVSLSTPYLELQKFCQKMECSSVTSILKTAWGCVIADFLEKSNKNIVLGEVLSERVIDPSLDDVIGPLVTLIPAPVKTAGTARELISQHDQTMSEAWKHRNINPGALRRIVKRPRDQPLYPAVFVFHPHTEESHDSNPWTEIEDIIGLNVEHELTLNVEERSDGGLDLVVSSEASVLSQDGVELLTKQLDALIAAMVMHPDQDVSELTNHFPMELLSMTDQRMLPLNETVDYSNPLCWLEHWAQSQPAWPAVEVAEQIGDGTIQTVTWSFSKLNSEANAVSAFIQSLEVRDRMIGMCLGRTLSAFAVTVGIFKSGNTYLPIDEDLPEERKAFLLQDSNAAIFFTNKEAIFAPSSCKVINVEKDNYKVESNSYHNIVRCKDDVAYLLYTSGSTGNPKGVLISCKNLTAFSEAQSEFICTHAPATLSLGGTGKWLGLASRAFDVHVAEMFLAWRHGLCAVTGKRSMLLDDLAMALKDLKVTHASFVPSLLDQVGLVPSDVPLLSFMSVGGEKISQRTLEAWGDSETVALVNAYGPTEATIGCCSARVSSKSNVRNIGNPLGDSVAHVLVPDTLRYAKRGMEGELCFTGSLVGIGYHNRDTGAFVEDFHGSKLYRTGDLVRMMPDGSIEIFGRSDDQTKIRGQRLELGEVSECVRSLSSEGTFVASVITKHPELSRMQLVSFVAQSKSSSGNETPHVLDTFDEVSESIRSGCKKSLPSYMVPDVVVPLSFLPLAATSGKADMKLLKKIFSSMPLRNLLSAQGGTILTKVVETRELHEDEEQIADLLKAMLRGSSPVIQPSTNIFEIGVDSLVAISLATLMRKHGYDCSVADVMSTDTVAELALLPRGVISDEESIAIKAAVKEKLAKIEFAFRCSDAGMKLAGKIAAVRSCLPVQEAVVAKSLDKDGSSAYVNHIVLELSPSIDISKLRSAWELVIKDNEILRTCFRQFENDILQVVLLDEASPIPWTECSSETSWNDIQENIARDIVENIGSTPPLRLNILEHGEPFTLYVSIHHSLYDAEALSMLLKDVYSIYKTTEVALRPPPAALVEHVLSISEDAAREYWTEAMHGYIPPPPETLSVDAKAQICTRTLKTSLVTLETNAASLKVTLPTLVQTAFGIAMAKASSTNDFVFGLVLSGRSIPVPGVEDILAPTITTVPQRIDLRDSNVRVSDILSSIQKASGKTLQFQHTSLRAIHKWAEADHPLFNCLSSFIKPGKLPSYDDLWKEVESYMPPDYSFAIEFEANAKSDKLIIRAGYTSDFGTEADVSNLLEMIELLIDTIFHGNSITVGSLGIKNQGQTKDIAVDDNQECSPQEQQIKDVLLAIGGFESEHVSRHSTFFRLGVDSVIAIRFAQQLRSAGLKVSSSDIARHSSIAQLSEHISSKTEVAREKAAPEVSLQFDAEKLKKAIPLLSEGDSISEIYTCTPLQSGLLTQTVATGGALYVHHPTIQLATDIDLGRLKTAWSTVVTSLDILRTSFQYVEDKEGRWVAAVHDKPLLIWNDLSSDSVTEAVKNIVASTIFPATKDFLTPPVKTTIVKSSSETVMVLSIHHSLYDGWSLPLIFDTLSTAYDQSSILPRTPFSLAAKLITERQEGSVNFWSQHLTGYTAIELPRSNERNPTTFSNIKLGMTTADALKRCKAMDVNLQSVALLTYGKALCCLVQRRDIVFGHVVSGRSLPVEEVEQIVGPLFNTVPVRCILDNPLSSNEDTLKRVQKIVVDGQDYQHASLNKIQKLWRQSHNGSDPLLDALFVFQKAVEDNKPSSDLWTPFEMEDSRDSTEYALNVEFEQSDHQLTLSTASSRLNAEDLNNFCLIFDKTFQDILNAPMRSVTAYPENLQHFPVSSPKIDIKSQLSAYENVNGNPALPIVRKAFSDVSNIPPEQIMLDTSIFALGIDSIAAIRVASECREQGFQLSVADILQGRCIGGIVQILMKKATISTANNKKEELPSDIREKVISRLHYPPSSVEQIIPCLAGQVYHLASWLNSGRTFYEPTWALRSREKIDADVLRKAWNTLQSKHSILRTVFVTTNSDNAYQIVLNADSIATDSFNVLQASGNFVAVVKQEVQKAYRAPSTLTTPAIGLQLIQGPNEDAVLIKLHHGLYDAWTMTSLINDLSEVYGQRSISQTPNFSDFVWHTRSALSNLDQKAFWKTTLESAEPTLLPLSYSKIESHAPHKQSFVWVRGAVSNLKEKTKICQASNLALSTIVAQAFACVLGQYCQTSRPTFGFFHTGRSASFLDTARVPGPCVNMLPMTISSEGRSDLEIALSIQEELSKRVPFEQSYLRDILRWKADLDPDSEFSRPQPLFNASLNLLWHGKQQMEVVSETKPLFEPMDIGVPTDYASEEPIPGVTAVDELETGYLAKQNLFVDVGPVEETDSIDFGVKCDFALMDEKELRVFVEAIAKEVERIVGGLIRS